MLNDTQMIISKKSKFLTQNNIFFFSFRFFTMQREELFSQENGMNIQFLLNFNKTISEMQKIANSKSGTF